MLPFKLISLYPEIFSSFLDTGIVKKAIEKERIDIEVVPYRQYGKGKHLHVDDSPYGGGAGMLMAMEPFYKMIQDIDKKEKTYKILLSAQGKLFTQQTAQRLAKQTAPISLICGRFEGFDSRASFYVDEEISLGDFILLGGEVAAMAIVEATSRLLVDVIGNQDSLEEESFNINLLEYQQYTRPAEFQGHTVPQVLLSGNHEEIKKWRNTNAQEQTKQKRPDLYLKYTNQT